MRKHTVLFVDDEANLLASIARMLRKEPYTIHTATSADEGLKRLRETDVDVIVSDQQMPGMSGTEFLREVRRRYPDTVRFLLTGNPSLDVALEAINEGAVTRFFVKPCNETELRVGIRQALQQRKLLRTARALLRKTREQQAHILRLKRAFPGITDVERTEDNAIVIDAVPDDMDALIAECEALATDATGHQGDC